ncbi:MAG: hypothetical protein J7L73_09115 [Anaerolineales bacterium]|nr:hypothetical protein [Anaerolineales bacterium]
MKKKRQRFIQAYSQTPWRKQLQVIGLFLVFIVFSALIAGIYLDVSSRMAEVGRKIQQMQDRILVLERENADLESQVAKQMSYEEISKRAEELGFHPYGIRDSIYIVVPGYVDRQPIQLAPTRQSKQLPKPMIEPEFTQTLVDWLREKIYYPPRTVTGISQ